jgi:hypothetical protein
MIGQAAKTATKKAETKIPFFPQKLSFFAFGIGISLAAADLMGFEPFNSKSVSAKDQSSIYRSHSTYYRHK